MKTCIIGFRGSIFIHKYFTVLYKHFYIKYVLYIFNK